MLRRRLPEGSRESSTVGRVAGVFDNPPGFPCTPPGVDNLEGENLTSNNVAGSSHDHLQSFAVASGAVSKPGGDTAGQDALHSAGVEGSEDSGACSKLPQPSQEEETLLKAVLFSRWERAVCRVKAIASSVERLLRNANCSGSSEAGSTEQM